MQSVSGRAPSYPDPLPHPSTLRDRASAAAAVPRGVSEHRRPMPGARLCPATRRAEEIPRQPRRGRLSSRRAVALLACVLGAAGVLAGTPTLASAQTRAAASFRVAGQLNGVAAVSADQAWAVGYAGSDLHPHLLIARWNGVKWQPEPGLSSMGGELLGVAAVSRTEAWAVGFTRGSSYTSTRAVVLRWNGASWSRVTLPSRGYSGLEAVAATSATNAWAVGFAGANIPKAVFVRWNGRAWKSVRAPAGPCAMDAVAAASTRSAWAAAECSSGGPNDDQFASWNGSAWKYVKFPLSGVYSYVTGLAAPAAASAWAVGYNAGSSGGALSMRWNGRAWQKVAVPLARESTLDAVAAKPGTVLAVGGGGSPITPKTFVLHWTGSAWKRLPSPSPGASAELFGVALSSSRDAWAVGYSGTLGLKESTLILHWNGSSWQ